MTGWDALYLTAALVGGVPYAISRRLRRRRLPDAWKRFTGQCADHVHLPIGPRIWLHGVSVGEVILLTRLTPALEQLAPNAQLVFSSTTDTGLETAARKLQGRPYFPFPFDVSWSVERVLDRLKPQLIVLAEAELWPNLLSLAHRRGIPVALVNARMSDRSYRRYRLVRPFARRILGRLALIAAQSHRFADRFIDLGAPRHRVCVTGSIKFDGLVSDRDNPSTRALRSLFGLNGPDQRVWVAGSTSEPEEDIVLDIYQQLRPRWPGLRLILVPRHPERFDRVVRLVERRGLAVVRRSAIENPPPPDAVIVVDTLGELIHVWGLAEFGFVGGSFARRGGQSMLEPAAYGVPTVYGPHVWNYRDAAEALESVGGAVRVRDRAELLRTIEGWLADRASCRAAGQRARALVTAQQGAARRTAERLVQLIDQSALSRAA